MAAVLLKAERLLEAGDAAGAERDARHALASDASWAEAHHLLGEVARRRGEFDAAARHYRRAIQLDGRLSYVHHALGNALQDAGRLHEAIDAYRRAVRLAPDSAEIWNDLGTAYFAAGQQQRAAQCYRKAVAHAPAHIVALSNLGSTLRALGDVRGALGAYRRELWQRLRAGFSRRNAVGISLTQSAERWLHRGSLRMAAALADLALNDDADSAAALAIKADIALRHGDAATAMDLTERSLRSAPQRADLWLRLARLRAAREEFADAVRAYREAHRHGERSVAAQRELALCIAGAEGLAQLRRLAEQSGDPDTWTALAKLSLDQRDELAAGEALTRALTREPSHAPALAQLARLRVAQRKATEALDLCESALESDPACVAAHFWRGRALGLLGRWMDAAEAFREALAGDASSIAAIGWLAIALRAAERIEESQTVLRDALARRPGNFELRAELVVSLFEGGELAQARELLEKLRAENPDHPGALAAMSWILNAEGRLDDAEAYARRALDLDPGHVAAHLNLGLALLKLGRYAQGWDHYDWRTKLEEDASAYLRFPYPQWDGSSLAGRTILVYAEQGLGDEIMFASCLPELVRQARQVVLECDPRLGELFKRSFPGCAVFGRKRTQANAWTRSLEPQPDVQCPIASLARHLRRSRADFPAHTGYLRPDRLKLERWRARLEALGPGRKMGVSWRGGLLKTGRARRSLELGEVAALLKLGGVRFVCLQYGAVGDELAMLERLHGVRVVHFPEAMEDYDEAAALIGALGGVLSVCTSVVHLTGALGRPALVMAPYSAEWRYGHSREEMPWYPSVRILRQPQPGDWAPVFAEARRTLETGWGGA